MIAERGGERDAQRALGGLAPRGDRGIGLLDLREDA
jgi:hypothetical protein